MEQKTQLMAYMPYGLQIAVTEHKDSFESEDYYDGKAFSKGAIWTLAGYADPSLNISMGEGEINGFIFNNGSTYISITSGYKPLLLPLSELIHELSEWLIKEMKLFVKGTAVLFLNKEWAKKTITGYFEEPLQTPYFICQKIFELHGDLFGLLDSGLALNKSTYKTTE